MAENHERNRSGYSGDRYAPVEYEHSAWRSDRGIHCRSGVQILAYVAETERTFIRQRQAEGIAAAQRRGIQFGCKKKNVPENFEKYDQLWCEDKISLRKAAADLQMNYSTFYRRCMDLKEGEKNKENSSKL